MSKIFKPRRGSVTTMTSTDKKNTVLAKGEMFIEVPNSSNIGPSRLIMGNGTDSYESISNNHKYAIDGVSGYITSEVNADSTATTTSDILNDVTSGKTIRNLFGNIKKAINKNAIDIAKNASDIASMNDNSTSGTLAYEIENMKSTFQDGVDTIVSAINRNGGNLPSRSTPSDCSTAIDAIRDGGDATAGQIVKNKTAYSGKTLLTGTFEAQEKTVTGSRYQQIVTPDSGKYLSKVTVNKYPDANGTYLATSRGSSLEMGWNNNYRYVNTNGVPNSNNETYSFPDNDTGGTKDLGVENKVRKVDASKVYSKGVFDGHLDSTVLTVQIAWQSNKNTGHLQIQTPFGEVIGPTVRDLQQFPMRVFFDKVAF